MTVPPAGGGAPSLLPRNYQADAMRQAAERNVCVRMDTGSGKTLIAVMLIRHITSLPSPASDGARGKKVFMVVPNVPLVSQQAAVLRSQTALRVRTFVGADGVEFWKRTRWTEELNTADVVVLTAQILEDLLLHAYWSLEDISLIVFDEAHHTAKNHPYNQIMKRYHERRAVFPAAHVPKIFGMTASPLFNPKSPAKFIAALEANLACKILEIQSPHLATFAPKPKELLVLFPPPIEFNREPSIFADDLMESGLFAPEDKFWEDLDGVKDKLGSLAGDIFIIQSLQQKLSSTSGSLDATTLLASLTPRLPSSIPLSSLSSKIRILVDKVLMAYQDKPSFHAILFVQKRHHAMVLAEVLKRIDGLAGWVRVDCLVGHGAQRRGQEGGNEERSKEVGMAIKEQEAAVARFRTGETNLLVATAVAEEGLDFRACNLVVRADEILTFVGYIQSRGRARAADSTFVVLAEEGSSEAARYQGYVSAEPELQQQYAATPDDDPDEADLSDLPTYTVPSTGAVLTHASAISLLSAVCGLVPVDDYTVAHKPEYNVSGTLMCWSATVTLPMMACLPGRRRFESLTLPTKKAAKQNAAFKACVELHANGGLDDFLLPIRKSRLVDAVNADGDRVNESAMPNFVELEVENPFGNVWLPSSGVWLSRVRIIDNGVERIIGLVTGREMPPFADAKLFDGAPERQVDISLLDSRPLDLTNEERADRLSLLDKFNRDCIILWLNRRLPREVALYSLWAPLMGDDIEWDLVKDPFPTPLLVDLRPGDRLVAPYARIKQRQLTFVDVRSDVDSLSPAIEIERDTGTGRARLLQRFPNYLDYVRVAFDYTDLSCSVPVPILRLQEVPAAASTSRLAPTASLPASSTPFPPSLRTRCYPQGMPRLNRLPSFWATFFIELPAVYRIVHDRARAVAALARFRLPQINLEIYVKALTSPACNTGYDYQALETLGDSVLKVLTTIHIYLEHPKLDEGTMCVIRQNSVDNRFLRQKAISTQYGSAVLTEVFRTQRWVPSTSEQCQLSEDGLTLKRPVGRRPLSDTIESTLGAAFLTGGIEMALETGNLLGLCFGGTEKWAERESGKALLSGTATGSPPGLVEVQKTLGYQFQDARLLRQAFTHRSYAGVAAHCYEREEHLGDALLDFWATIRLYSLFPSSTARRLTFLRALLVSNVTLAFLALRVLNADRNILHSSGALDIAIKQAMSELESSSFDWTKILKDLTWLWDAPKVLGDVFEAVIGAIFIDSGFDLDTVLRVLDGIYAEVLPILRDVETRDPFSQLLMFVQARHCSAVRIETTMVSGARRLFESVATFHADTILSTQTSSSKAVARQLAARDAATALHPDNFDWDDCSCSTTPPDVPDHCDHDSVASIEKATDIGEAQGKFQVPHKRLIDALLSAEEMNDEEDDPEWIKIDEDVVDVGIRSRRVRLY